jgi:hypothetical protein
MRQTSLSFFTAALALIASATVLDAQSGLRQVPLGFCTNSSLSAAVGLSSFTGSACSTPATLAQATYGVICAYTQGVVWRDDGTAPTATPGTGGQGIAANQCFPYTGTFTAIQFIQQTSGAILGVALYR